MDLNLCRQNRGALGGITLATPGYSGDKSIFRADFPSDFSIRDEQIALRIHRDRGAPGSGTTSVLSAQISPEGLGKARVAAARKLGIRLWIMLRDQIDYQEFCRRGQMQQKSGGACAGMPVPRYGAKSHRLID
jgi:hypothetical protein